MIIRSEKRAILILRGGALGDVLLTIPALRFLRNIHPLSTLFLAARIQVAKLLKDCRVVDEIIDIDGRELLFLYANTLREDRLSPLLRTVFKVVSFLNDNDGTIKRNLKNLEIIDYQQIPPPDGIQHATLHFLQHVGCDLSTEYEINMSLILPEEYIVAGRRIKNKIADRICVIHAGSGSARKNWPLDNFISLADDIAADFGIKPVFTIGEADCLIYNEIKTRRVEHPCVKNLSLMELAGLIGVSEFYVGNDSGVTHLAAAIGKPAIALFGPTNPKIWAPLGTDAIVIKARNTDEEHFGIINIKEIISAISSVIKKTN